MKTASTFCVLLLTAWLIASSANHALAAETQRQIVDGTDPKALVAIIQDLGYRALLEVDGDGDPMIRSSVGGTQFAVVFYGCSDTHDPQEIATNPSARIYTMPVDHSGVGTP